MGSQSHTKKIKYIHKSHMGSPSHTNLSSVDTFVHKQIEFSSMLHCHHLCGGQDYITVEVGGVGGEATFGVLEEKVKMEPSGREASG